MASAFAPLTKCETGDRVDCEARCRTNIKETKACFQLGRLLEPNVEPPGKSHDELIRRPDDAESAFTAACARGLAEACVDAGWYEVRGVNWPGWDTQGGWKDLVTACDASFPSGCYELGAFGVEVDDEYIDWQVPVRTVHGFDRACSLGLAKGCRGYGILLAHGKFIDRDDARALALFGQACNGGDGEGCTWAARLLSGTVGYGEPSTVPKDPGRVAAFEKKAADAYEVSCPAGGGGCTQLFEVRAKRDGRKTPQPDDIDAYQKGCHHGDGDACQLLGAAYLAGQSLTTDPAKAAELFQRGCTLRSAMSCQALGDAYAQGLGIAKDPGRGWGFHRRACHMAAHYCDAHGVDLMASGPDDWVEEAHGDIKDYGVKILRRGCRLDNPKACLHLSKVLVQTRLGDNHEEAAEVVDQACDLFRLEEACTWRKQNERLLLRPKPKAAKPQKSP